MQSFVIEEFSSKQDEILSFVLRGKGKHQSRFMIITLENNDQGYDYHIDSIQNLIKLGKGEVKKTSRGNFKIGNHITVQRKGGTWGAHQLQFKWKNIFPS